MNLHNQRRDTEELLYIIFAAFCMLVAIAVLLIWTDSSAAESATQPPFASSLTLDGQAELIEGSQGVAADYPTPLHQRPGAATAGSAPSAGEGLVSGGSLSQPQPGVVPSTRELSGLTQLLQFIGCVASGMLGLGLLMRGHSMLRQQRSRKGKQYASVGFTLGAPHR